MFTSIMFRIEVVSCLVVLLVLMRLIFLLCLGVCDHEYFDLECFICVGRTTLSCLLSFVDSSNVSLTVGLLFVMWWVFGWYVAWMAVSILFVFFDVMFLLSSY